MVLDVDGCCESEVFVVKWLYDFSFVLYVWLTKEEGVVSGLGKFATIIRMGSER